MNNGKFDGGGLSADQTLLRQFYQKKSLISACVTMLSQMVNLRSDVGKSLRFITSKK